MRMHLTSTLTVAATIALAGPALAGSYDEAIDGDLPDYIFDDPGFRLLDLDLGDNVYRGTILGAAGDNRDAGEFVVPDGAVLSDIILTDYTINGDSDDLDSGFIFGRRPTNGSGDTWDYVGGAGFGAGDVGGSMFEDPTDDINLPFSIDPPLPAGPYGFNWTEFGDVPRDWEITVVVTLIPEPATAGILGVGGLALLRRRR